MSTTGRPRYMACGRAVNVVSIPCVVRNAHHVVARHFIDYAKTGRCLVRRIPSTGRKRQRRRDHVTCQARGCEDNVSPLRFPELVGTLRTSCAKTRPMPRFVEFPKEGRNCQRQTDRVYSLLAGERVRSRSAVDVIAFIICYVFSGVDMLNYFTREIASLLDETVISLFVLLKDVMDILFATFCLLNSAMWRQLARSQCSRRLL